MTRDRAGKLYVVGMGCGSREGMTIEAQQAITDSDLIVGYTVYTNLLKGMFPEKEMRSTGMRREVDRVTMALEEAGSGKTVSLVCSGDAVVYGMAALTIELCAEMKQGADPEKEWTPPEIQMIAGVTAALSGGALLGAPLTSDFAVISLSDLLTPMEKIERRLRAAGEGDFAMAIYNPTSKGRPHHLQRACEILLESRSPENLCGYVRQIGREGQESGILTLGELKDFQADMFTTVFVGSSDTVVIDGKLVTPRGYRAGRTDPDTEG